MNHPCAFAFTLILSAALLFTACDSSGNTTVVTSPSGLARGDLVAFANLTTLVLAYANDGTEITFPTVLDDTGTATISGDFYIGRTEVTSALFVTVYQWAYDNGRFSATVTDHNGVDSTTANYGGKQLISLAGSTTVDYSGGAFTVVADSGNKPVANVTW